MLAFCVRLIASKLISADTIDTFKNRSNKFLKNQDTVYDYKCDLTGIGNRSLINMDRLYIVLLCYLMGIEASPAPIFCFAWHCFPPPVSFVISSCATAVYRSVRGCPPAVSWYTSIDDDDD